MPEEKPVFICVTPVRNEGKILDRFLKCASLWADSIIISDQCSMDNTIEIALKYPKVILITNNEEEYNEKQIRQLLIDEARKIKGPKIIFAVDADEALTPEILNFKNAEIFYNSCPGTTFMANFVNICSDFNNYWNGPIEIPLAFYDDGSPYIAEKIHTYRNICPENAYKLKLKNIKIMHFQYTNWDRMESKHRWYQCWEKINNPQKSSIEIYRSYHHMYSVKNSEINPLPGYWLAEYLKMGINLKEEKTEENYYWDKQVLNYFKEHGTKYFSKIALWDVNWSEKAVLYEMDNLKNLGDPRTVFEKFVHRWLKGTQKTYERLFNRLVSKIFKIAFKW